MIVPGDTPDRDFVRDASGLLPFVRKFICFDWDWRPWMTEPPAVPLLNGGPKLLGPGYVADDVWTIAFEGAYPWAASFTAATNDEGPLNAYLLNHRLFVDCQTGYALRVERWRAIPPARRHKLNDRTVEH